MKLVQEADELAYRCAFACQKQAYIVTTAKGSHDFKAKFTKTEIIAHFKKKDKHLDVDYKLEGYSLIEPEHIVKYTLDRMIDRLWQVEHPSWERCVQTIPGGGLSCITEIELWLSPSDHSNFRYKLTEIMGPHGLGYKAGRGAKPHYLKFIRELLIEKYGAKEAFGYEADDALGLAASENVILSHIDKDMNMIEGWHYNHVTQEVYYVEEGLGSIDYIDGKVVGRGILFFYLQLLTGDAIDNIPGCKNPAKGHHTKPPNISGKEGVTLLQNVEDEADAFNVVGVMFQHTYEDNWLSALMECADLLWICRQEGVTGRQYLKNKGFI